MSNIINQIETEQLKQNIPDFRPGDTVIVKVKVKEGTRERLQAFEGVVIAKRNRGLNSAFTVRKISSGEGVERVFQTHSNIIAEIIIKRRGDVRKAKLYYLRDRTGRSARIKEKLNFKERTKGEPAASAADMEEETLEAVAEEAVQQTKVEESAKKAELEAKEAAAHTEEAKASAEKSEAAAPIEAKAKEAKAKETKTEKE